MCVAELLPNLQTLLGIRKYILKRSIVNLGVPVVALWLTNPTRNHEVAGSIPGLDPWVKDPALP